MGSKVSKPGEGIRARLVSNAPYTIPNVELSALRCRRQVWVFDFYKNVTHFCKKEVLRIQAYDLRFIILKNVISDK